MLKSSKVAPPSHHNTTHHQGMKKHHSTKTVLNVKNVGVKDFHTKQQQHQQQQHQQQQQQQRQKTTPNFNTLQNVNSFDHNNLFHLQLNLPHSHTNPSKTLSNTRHISTSSTLPTLPTLPPSSTACVSPVSALTPSIPRVSKFDKRTFKVPKKTSFCSTQTTQTSTTTTTKRFYEVPHYTGFRNAFEKQLSVYASRPITPVSLHTFLDWPINHAQLNTPGTSTPFRPTLDVHNLGDQKYSTDYQQKIVDNAQFLWNELPIRLSQRVVELQNLPYGLSQLDQFKLLRYWYESSFKDITQSLPPINIAQERNFTRVLNSILNRHRSVIPTLAQGILLQKPIIYQTTGGEPCNYIKGFLDKFYGSRIAIRMLISQHIALHKPIAGFCGTIHLELDPVAVIRGAAQEVVDLCERTYGIAPDINIYTTKHDSHRVEDHTFPHMSTFNPVYREKCEREEKERILEKMKNIHHYSEYVPEPNRIIYVSSHLHHMVFELLKNSARAHAEYYSHLKQIPDVNIFVSFSSDDITIKISDVGGGIPLKNQNQLFSYLFSSADSKVQESLKRFDIQQTLKHNRIHDDHITFIGAGTQYNTPLSIRGKTGLTSISNSSILPQDSLRGGSISIPKGDNGSTSASPGHIPSQGQSQSNFLEESPTDGGVFMVANEQQGFGSGMMRLAPISGFGYGLALSRLFAQFGGGDLRLYSAEGHGVDTLLNLNKISSLNKFEF